MYIEFVDVPPILPRAMLYWISFARGARALRAESLEAWVIDSGCRAWLGFDVGSFGLEMKDYNPKGPST